MNKKHLQRIIELFQAKQIYNFSDTESQEMKDTIDFLCNRGVLKKIEMDNANAYRKIGDFSIFNEWYKEQDKQEKREKRSNRWHDVQMVILGAILGGLVEFLLFKFFGIGG